MLALCLVASASQAQDWSQWRGPGRDGTVIGANLPASWPSTVKRVWRVEVGEGYSSPVVAAGRVFVHSRRDPDELVTPVDVQSGKVVWQPGYASPIVFTSGAVRQLVTLTDQSIVGIDAKTGVGLWSVAFPDDWHDNIVTPVWTGTHLIVSGVRQGTQAYTLSNAGGKWQVTQAWKNTDVTMYLSAPVVANGTLYGISNKRKGQFVALDTATGAVRWATDGREGDHASIFLAPGHVVFLTNAGDLIVAKRDPTKFAEERRIEVADGETWAVPAFIQGGLGVRDAQGLVRLAWGS